VLRGQLLIVHYGGQFEVSLKLQANIPISNAVT
jgi:hypothetical protein